MRLRTSCWVRMCGPVEGLNISMLWKWSGKVRPLVPRPAVLSFFSAVPLHPLQVVWPLWSWMLNTCLSQWAQILETLGLHSSNPLLFQ